MSRPALIMQVAALAILLLMALWGAFLYPTVPDQIPTHWDLSGEADAFEPKSLRRFFAPLIVAAVLAIFVFAVQFWTRRALQMVPAERRASDLTFGYVNLSMVAFFAWASYSSWYGLSVGPLFIVLVLLAGLPVLVIYGLHLPAINKERKAMLDAGDPSLDPRFWVLGGFFYNNPNDPRAFVPKPPHTGTGVTMNLASPGGRLALMGLLLVLVGSVVLVFAL